MKKTILVLMFCFFLQHVIGQICVFPEVTIGIKTGHTFTNVLAGLGPDGYRYGKARFAPAATAFVEVPLCEAFVLRYEGGYARYSYRYPPLPELDIHKRKDYIESIENSVVIEFRCPAFAFYAGFRSDIICRFQQQWVENGNEISRAHAKDYNAGQERIVVGGHYPISPKLQVFIESTLATTFDNDRLSGEDQGTRVQFGGTRIGLKVPLAAFPYRIFYRPQ